jgi:peptidyl-dipeptidase Dcp
MRRLVLSLVLALPLAAALPTALAEDAPTPTPTPVAASATQVNPLLPPWTGPHGGLPPLDKGAPELFAPALELAMRELLEEVDAIASQKPKPTFANTIEAFEDTGRTLGRVRTVYGVYVSTMSGAEMRAVEQEMAPKLAALWDEIVQNEALFQRIEAVYTSKKFKKLTPEQQRLTWYVYKSFVRGGAKLDAPSKERLAAINQDLAGLYTRFGQNLLADEETFTVVEQVERLDGLPPGFIASAAEDAKARGLEGKWVIVNTRSSVDPVLTNATDRALREEVWRGFVSRGDRGGDTDNNALITEILKLRVERAKLLGYATHAHWRTDDAMAPSPEAALALLESTWGPAVARVKQEVADQQAVADAEGAGIKIEPWDYRFYQEKVRKARYDLDQAEVKPYLQLEKLREGMFWSAGELYGLKFEPITGVPVNHPDVRVWEVKDKAGAHVGLFYFDPYARPGKRSGAWMNAYRKQESFRGEVSTIVSNNSNFVKGAPGEPVLVSWDDAETLFHEFGHAIHGLLSDVAYPSLSGTAVSRDFVEFPSQINEAWLATPEVLNRFALHVETGKPIPPELVAKIQKAATFNQGFATTEYLASALIDLKLHLAGDATIDPDAFERDTLAAMGMPSELVMRHRTPQFGHVFSGDGYSSAYYSYLWADALTADATEAFVEAGSMWDPATAERFKATILSVGNTVDPAEAFRAFRGRDVDTAALMRSRGFPVAGEAAK